MLYGSKNFFFFFLDISFRVVSEDQTAVSETDSENSNSQTFEMVEKEDVDNLKMEEKGTEEQKGSGIEEIKEDKQSAINDDSS